MNPDSKEIEQTAKPQKSCFQFLMECAASLHWEMSCTPDREVDPMNP
jgi:hypothetical protein